MAGQRGRGGDAPADPAGRPDAAEAGVADRDDNAAAAADSRDGAAADSQNCAAPDSQDGAAAEPGEADSGDALAARLAEIWAMIAEADPELAKRVPGYLTAAD